MPTKILDSTTIIAFDKEIVCVDILGIMARTYKTCISHEVSKECRSSPRIDEFMRTTSVYSKDLITLEKASKYLEKRYNYRLGAGERSSISLSIMLSLRGIDNYLVTDDKYARSVADNIHLDCRIGEIFDSNIQKIKYTGTIGLIKRLVERGTIDKEVLNPIAEDIENGSFRASPELLSFLRS